MNPGTGLRVVRGALVPWLLLSLGAASIPAASADSATERHEARGRRLVEEFVAGWVARHPEEASRLGDRSADERLPDGSASALAGDAAWYRAQRDSLDALPLAELSPALAVDVRLARARAAHEVRRRDVDRADARDPGFWLGPLDVAIREPLRGFYASSCTRAVTLRQRLRAVPEYLRQARIALDPPDRFAIDRALERVALLMHRCRVELPRAFETCREAALQADLAVADTLATHALGKFADDLGNLPPRGGPGTDTRGPADLARDLAEVAGAPVALDSLLAVARGRWAALPSAADTEDLGPLFASPIDADSAEGMFEDVRRALVENGTLASRDARGIALREQAPLRALDRVTLLGAWDPRGERAQLELGARPAEDPTWAGDATVVDPRRSPLEFRLALAREGVPGRAWFALAEGRYASRARQALGVEAVREGWARYVERLWAEACAGVERERVAHAIARIDRARLARAIAELNLAIDGGRIEGAQQWLERSAGLAPEFARRVALEARAAPQEAAALVAQDAWQALRAEAESRLGEQFDAAAFHEAASREGAVPTAWVAEGILENSTRPGRPRR